MHAVLLSRITSNSLSVECQFWLRTSSAISCKRDSHAKFQFASVTAGHASARKKYSFSSTRHVPFHSLLCAAVTTDSLSAQEGETGKPVLWRRCASPPRAHVTQRRPSPSRMESNRVRCESRHIRAESSVSLPMYVDRTFHARCRNILQRGSHATKRRNIRIHVCKKVQRCVKF